MQRGYIFKHRQCWYVRFYDYEFLNGQRIRKQRCRKLAPIGEEYPTKRSVWSLADKILTPVNDNRAQPESAMRAVDFIEKIFLPYVQKELRAATYKNYKKEVFERHLKNRLGNVRLRDFRTVTGQRLIQDIANANSNIGHKTLQRIKSFLSGTFKHAKRQGLLDGENPIRDVSVPGRPKKFHGEVYSLDEVERLLITLPEPARTVIAVAALTGLRHSEIRGLRWSDFDGENLKVSRSVWRTHVQAPKTESSENVVPILPLLQRVLEKHKSKIKSADKDAYIFAGERRGAPLNLANLVNRTIKPALASKDCLVPWKGWHAFRRGLASNLYSLGIQPKVIQAIMRHSDIGTTLDYYVQTSNDETREAILKIEECFPFGL
jgi:integrase